MLELRPSCEHCGCALPPESTKAMICSFECTFCRDCVNNILANVCPNCGGGFTPRPNRPRADLKNGHHLTQYPAGQRFVHKPVDIEAHQIFAKNIKHVPPEQR